MDYTKIICNVQFKTQLNFNEKVGDEWSKVSYM